MLRRLSIAYVVWLIPIMILLSDASFASGLSITNFDVPYTSYIVDFWENSVPAPQAYLPSQVISGEDMGVGALRNPNDLCVSNQGNIYIADTGNNRVVVVDSEWNLIRAIGSFVSVK